MYRLLTIALLCMTPILAQPPREAWAWWDSPVRNNINLTPQQLRQVNLTLREYRGKLIDLRGAVQKAELDIQDVFNDDPFDAKKATEAVAKLADARADLIRTVSQLSIRLRAILTTEQWHELQRLRGAELEREKAAKGPRPR